MFTLNFSFKPLNNLGVRVSDGLLKAKRAIGMTAYLLVLIHAMMSFILLNPVVYKTKFFHANGTLSLMAELSMLGGILALVALWAYNLSFQTLLKENNKRITFITSRKIMLTAMLFISIHLFFMGYTGWIAPNTWFGGLPPIA